ncbi:helix-turn-helix transcriptional regulator [Alteribacter populi]|uniref:helix-turn-helix transcriptional regulator n=1 Tax=Alteribacter populi TaxID=2011011 RepID=UPI000BBA467C|nr:helix-turn-helix transcriptional regulator [Alteribacter populi]
MMVPEIYHCGVKGCLEETTFYWVHFSFPRSYSLVDETEVDWSHIMKQESTYIDPAQFQLHLPRYGKITNEERLYHHLSLLNRLNPSQSPLDKLKQQSIFYECMIIIQQEAVQIPTSAETVSSEAVSYIKEHFNDPSLTLTGISSELLYHPDYVTRCMRRTTGLTPNQYLTRYRLEIAKELIIKTNQDLGAVSKEVGITDRSYFSRVFKKIEGITPNEFRRMRANESARL